MNKAARFTEADVYRAIKAARKAGECMAVEILPDGTIRLVPAERLESAELYAGRREAIPL